MSKSDKQLLIEATHPGKDWQDVLNDSLARYKGKRNLVALVSADVGITDQTLYNWTRALDIDLNDYR